MTAGPPEGEGWKFIPLECPDCHDENLWGRFETDGSAIETRCMTCGWREEEELPGS